MREIPSAVSANSFDEQISLQSVQQDWWGPLLKHFLRGMLFVSFKDLSLTLAVIGSNYSVSCKYCKCKYPDITWLAIEWLTS